MAEGGRSLKVLGVRAPESEEARGADEAGKGGEVVVVAGGDVCFDRHLRASVPVVNYGCRTGGGGGAGGEGLSGGYGDIPLLNLPDAKGCREFLDPYDEHAMRIAVPKMSEEEERRYPLMHLKDVFSGADTAGGASLDRRAAPRSTGGRRAGGG